MPAPGTCPALPRRRPGPGRRGRRRRVGWGAGACPGTSSLPSVESKIAVVRIFDKPSICRLQRGMVHQAADAVNRRTWPAATSSAPARRAHGSTSWPAALPGPARPRPRPIVEACWSTTPASPRSPSCGRCSSRSPTGCWARRRIASSHARATPSAEVHRPLADALVAAFRAGDVRTLVAVLREDVVALTDGGGEALAARRPVLGRDRVLRLFAGLLAKAPPELRVATVGVNGTPGLVVHAGDGPIQVVQIVTDPGGRIAEILFVLAPSKLAFARRQRPRLGPD